MSFDVHPQASVRTGAVAVYSARDEERWVSEPAKNPRRSAFQRDRARVLHSAGLRRLGAKTQVVSPGTDDFVRTRLTHSLEVAQVGRELARYLGCDPDIVDTACLSHDLGHPPFGHHGETILDALCADIGGFEGNAQTLRLVTRIEPKVIAADGRPAGLNLTRASLDALTKYPWSRSEASTGRRDSGVRKFGVYDDDTAVFDFYRAGIANGRKCLEAQVMDLADDISYSVHDVEDAVVAGHLHLSEFTADARRAELFDITRMWYLPETSDAEMDKALSRLQAAAYWPAETFDGSRRVQASLKHMTSQLIGRFIGAAEAATREEYGWEPLARYSASLVVPEQTGIEIAVLKGMATLTVMVAEDRLRLHDIQSAVITELSQWYAEKPGRMDPMFAADHAEAADDAARLRVIVDQIASLTDHSAWALYHRLKAGEGDRL
ncbi:MULTISPECIES: deoxyguanosinetriphosphate triphosphohydrolase [unclassified Brevibacterium]|uniref:deoxyguanosinetriphosphate triphosphohydrolase n=1 Tax=unclassified Brevibacterium TaxID=2614124 RepID=UPI001E4E3961|nr:MULTISPECIES: deoxyguanosinetriphosphate triphosphohydrolase [unclassified Brevibacterium]MCD1285068.1 deoxyguanosinetriphosphate triphosphohydrolase [Brevibacterium sp. CCUG 69071]MDK8435309.1 deoxyguanosinetriphosphate triphosphohydrolase [Brevibacterium sp. H-BE7]